MLKEHKDKALSATVVVVILMLCGVVVGIFTYGASMNTSETAISGANEAYEILANDVGNYTPEGAYPGGGGFGSNPDTGEEDSEEGVKPSTPIEFNITYNANGGTFTESSNNVVNYKNYTIDSGIYLEPTNNEYHFVGWSTTQDIADGVGFDPTVDISNVKGDITVYAIWLAPAYVIYSETDNSLTFYNNTEYSQI